MALQTTQSWRRRGIYPCALLKTVDTVSRPGGDEFIVLLTELTRAEDAADVARKVIAALADVHIVAGHPLRLSVSIEISVFPDDGQEADTLLKGADMALYSTKEQEPGCYRFFRPELNVRARERQAIEIGLRDGLERQEFRLLYQPKINLKTGAVAGAESLIRWQHPERGLLEPGGFVPIAEACGLIEPMGRWVVHEACRQARAWQDAGLRPVPVSVNISVLEFRNKAFVQHIADILTQTVAPTCIAPPPPRERWPRAPSARSWTRCAGDLSRSS